MQEFLARRQDAGAAMQPRLAASRGSRGRTASPGPGIARTAVATIAAADRESVPAWSSVAMVDIVTLYAEATLV